MNKILLLFPQHDTLEKEFQWCKNTQTYHSYPDQVDIYSYLLCQKQITISYSYNTEKIVVLYIAKSSQHILVGYSQGLTSECFNSKT